MLNQVTTSIKFIILASFLTAFIPTLGQAQSENNDDGMSPLLAAKYIHSVIEANRTIYSELIVERLGTTNGLAATEDWEKENALPLPAQFLVKAAENSNAKGIGMHYRLISLWPINKNNGPQSNFETKGLEQNLKNPTEPFSQMIAVNGKPFYRAIFPDKAVSKSCVQCHNKHPQSPKRDFKRGDIMGGIIIDLPLEKSASANDSPLIAPEVVADYIHSILESTRTVYSETIVDRLHQMKIAYASENWWEDNTLLLPAQFLLDASDLIAQKNVALDFKLISLWPINPQNGSANEFERNGLRYVQKHQTRPYFNKTTLSRKKFFEAIYPDFAVTPACVECHNKHPKSPKKDFKIGDVMGGISLFFTIK